MIIILRLIEADEKYIDQYKEAYNRSMELIEEGKLKRHNLMFINPDEKDVIQFFKDNKDQSKLPPEYVPAYSYFAVDEDKFIGIINIRIRLTEKLLHYGGHIGYGTNPKYWRMGYGKKILKLALEEYNNLIEEDNILITCDDDNIGSAKIIEANGGVLENKVETEDVGEYFITRRYWIKKSDINS